MPDTKASGTLAVWTDVLAQHEAEFNDWYLQEHLHERLALPGFLSARRYAAAQGAPRYFALYETDSVSALASSAYRERLTNPTQWTRRVMPWFVNTNRCVCVRSASVGAGVGGVIATLGFNPAPASEAQLRDWITQALLPRMPELPGFVRAQLWETDPGVSGLPNPERELRAQADAIVGWVIAVEAEGEAQLPALLARVDREELARRGAAAIAVSPVYRLMCYFDKASRV
jgi:hypothetical protein